MKTDNFDEAFRRKVESFHPPFRDDEIDQIQGYVNQHIPLSFWQRFGHTFTYSLTTIIIVSLLTNTIYQANENKNLLNKIANLNNKLEQNQAVIAVNDTPKSVFIEKFDTIYVVKHIIKEIPVIEEINSSSPSITQLSEIETQSVVSVTFKEENIGRLNSKETTKNTGLVSANNVQKVSNLTNPAKPNEVVIANRESKNSRPNVIKTGILPTKVSEVRQVSNLPKDKNFTEKVANEQMISSQSNAIKSSSSVESNFSDNTTQVGNVLDNSLQINTDKVLAISDLRRKMFSSFDLKFAFDLSNRRLHSPHYVAKPKEHKSFRFPNVAMPNLKYRVGLGANADLGQVGTSLLTDILFAKRWSVTSGVNMSFLGFERFGDEDDFRRRTDKDFRDEHGVTIPITNPIENIEAHQILFRVPIYLNYRLPLRRDYTVLFSTGTDIDLQLKQFTSYSHHDFAINEKQEGIQEKIPVTLFNNWMASVGIEKRWKYFSVQLSPYTTYQIKHVSYRKEDFAFGLKLNSFYRLSR
jgi:hypothetical protein